MQPTDWGVAVENGNKVYLHITNPDAIKNKIELKYFPYTLVDANWFETGRTIKFNSSKKTGHVALHLPNLESEAIDQVIVLEVKR